MLKQLAFAVVFLAANALFLFNLSRSCASPRWAAPRV